MTPFMKYLMTIPLEDEDKLQFIEDCRTWESFVERLNSYNKLTTLKMIKYFATERMSAKRMLARAIMKFNSLNRLTKEHLR